MKLRLLAALLLLPLSQIAKADLCVDPATGRYITCTISPTNTTSALSAIAAKTVLCNATTAAATPSACAVLPPPLARSYPVYFAHRGNDSIFPEETQAAFDGLVTSESNTNQNPVWLNIKVRTLGDGTLGVIHDDTVDRTTTGTGAVTSFNATTWANLVVDADTALGTLAFSDTLSLPTLPALLTRYLGRANLEITSQDGSSMAAIITAVNSSGFPKTQVILASENTGLSEVTLAKAAGFETEWIDFDTACASFTAAQHVAAGTDWVTCLIGTTYDPVLTGANIAPYIAAGIKVSGFPIVRRWQAAYALSIGMSGLWADDIEYIKTNRQLQTSDNFAKGYFNPGMLGYTPSNPSYGYRGSFLTGGWYAFANSTTGNYLGQTLGFLSPVGNTLQPVNWQFSFTAQYTALYSSDVTRWIGVWIGTDDHAFYAGTNNPDHANGYLVLFRDNAQISIYSRTSGSTESLLGASSTGSTIPLSTSVYFCVVVTPTQIIAKQTSAADCGGAVIKSETVSDTTYRGGYLQVGSQGVSYQISSLKAGKATPEDGSFATLTSNSTATMGGTAFTVTAPMTLSFGTSLSQANWSSTGIGLKVATATFNDTTTGSATVPAEFAYSIKSPTFTNTEGTANVMPNLGTLYVDPPICGAGWSSCTNLYSIFSQGKIYGGTGMLIQGATVSLNAASDFNVNINTSAAAATTTLGNASSTFTMSAGTVNGTGWAHLPAITTASAFTSTLATGTAPFTVASTTNVANLNASSLGGATFAAPGPIGSGTASTGAFSTLTIAGNSSEQTLMQSAIPFIMPPSGFFANNGALVIGKVAGSSATATFGATSGSTTITFSAGTPLTGTAADVGRTITVLDTTYKRFTITTGTSSTVATGTLSATLSGTGPFANGAVWISGTPATTNTAGADAVMYPVSLIDTSVTNSWTYFPAGAIVAAGAAGWYWTLWNSVSQATVYNSVYTTGTTGQPVVGVTTAFSTTGPGAYTQSTGLTTQGPAVTVVANSMGVNGSLELTMLGYGSASTNNKQFNPYLSTTQLNQFNSASATNFGFGGFASVTNRGVTNKQVAWKGNGASGEFTFNTGGSTFLYPTIDTTADQSYLIALNMSTATDMMILERYSLKLYPKP